MGFARRLVVDGQEWLPSTATVWQPRHAIGAGAVAARLPRAKPPRCKRVELRNNLAAEPRLVALARMLARPAAIGDTV
ncbi:MAG: hypothetical protein WAK84_14445, partial [Candidatus Cybelea sp.]